MEESRATPIWNRNTELHATAVSRALWRSRSRRRAAETHFQARLQGPYETSYDVAFGYCADRSIVQP